ncbi:hypothetical protein AY599_08980 [Leptolyngbya valderiana BDU 20041]|nr:hypothetical protein AY599_08980 [Leptolyngbya valderiana BDU 20041]
MNHAGFAQSTLVSLLVAIGLSTTLIGCASFEEAGENIDEGVEEVADEVEEAGDEIEEETDDID